MIITNNTTHTFRSLRIVSDIILIVNFHFRVIFGLIRDGLDSLLITRNKVLRLIKKNYLINI